MFQLKDFDAFGESAWWVWPIVAAGFVAAEAIVIRVHLGSETTAVTFLELPLFLAALYVTPTTVWGAMVIGVTFSMFVIERAPLRKGVFNVANSAVQGAVGLWVFHALVSGSEPLGPAGWGSAAVAAIVSSALGAAAILLVLFMIEGPVAAKGFGHAVTMGAVTAVANVSLALIGAILIDYRPLALALLILPTGILFGAYRAYTSERAQRDRVQAMHDLALEVRSIRDQAGIAPVLRVAAEHLGALSADLVLFPDHRGGGQAMQFHVEEDSESTNEVVSAHLADVLDRVHALSTPEFAESAGGHAQLVGAIRGEGRALGLLKFEGRLREGSRFTDDDLAMFVTLGEQLGLTFEKNQLGQAVSQLERRGRELQHEANHDVLTGLPNRSLLASRLDAELQFERRPSLLFVDLDDFKDVNDQHGHDAGDAVLIEIARRFATVVGKNDCVARLGGDEFAVLLSQYSDDVGVASALISVTSEPINLSSGPVQVHASVGIARATRGQDSSALLKQADGAMYHAKEQGKGTLAIA